MHLLDGRRVETTGHETPEDKFYAHRVSLRTLKRATTRRAIPSHLLRGFPSPFYAFVVGMPSSHHEDRTTREGEFDAALTAERAPYEYPCQGGFGDFKLAYTDRRDQYVGSHVAHSQSRALAQGTTRAFESKRSPGISKASLIQPFDTAFTTSNAEQTKEFLTRALPGLPETCLKL